MLVVRNRSIGTHSVFFGLGFCVFALFPTEVGYQDIASLLAQQPGVGERWQKRVYSAVSTIQLATYSFGRPIGTSIPHTATYQLANLDSFGIDITGSVTHNPLMQNPLTQVAARYQASDFPKVDRTFKGDRLVLASTEALADTAPSLRVSSISNASVAGAKTADAASSAERVPLDPELQDALSAPPLAQYDVSRSLESQPPDDLETLPNATAVPLEPILSHDSFSVKTASLFFGSSSLGGSLESIERWQPGEEPQIVIPGALPDPDMKVMVSLPSAATEPSRANESGETVAAKGKVNTDDQHAKTPATRLGLFGEKTRTKSEKCLAEAVYFEARGEAVRGQIAVAQVVMNRTFSGFYPSNVCGVVYQNKHRHLACQFTFACDKVADVVREPGMWDRAKKIAKAMLDGQLWLPEVGKSTHYHAYWVRPSWVHEMKKMYKFGVHTFYRPRAWGNGSEAPSWGTSTQTAEISAELAEEAKSSAELSARTVRR